MKKAFSVLLCLAMLLSLIACNSEAQKNCHSCDKLIPATANFCEYCGASLQTEDIAENETLDATKEGNPANEEISTWDRLPSASTFIGDYRDVIQKMLGYEVLCSDTTFFENGYMCTLMDESVTLICGIENGKVTVACTRILPYNNLDLTKDERLDAMTAMFAVAALYKEGDTSKQDLVSLIDSLETVDSSNGSKKSEGMLDCIKFSYQESGSLLTFQASYIDANESETDANNIDAYAPSWYSTYREVLTTAADKYPNYSQSCNYSIFDVNKDGSPELFVKTGTCEADYEYNVYSYTQSTNEATHIATFGGGFSTICGLGEEKVFLIHYAHQGYEKITKGSLKNNSLVQETIFEREVINYHELIPLPTYEINNHSGLYWNENPYEYNQRVLDNYSTAGADNNKDAFSDLTVDPSYMWQGNDVFSRFFDEHFANSSAIGWEHLGINGDYFTLPNDSEPTWVDVYRVYASDGSSDRYYIIPYGEIQLTEVYEATSGTDTKLVWSIPLNEYYDWMN